MLTRPIELTCQKKITQLGEQTGGKTSRAVELTCQEMGHQKSEQTDRETGPAIELERVGSRQEVLGEQTNIFGMNGPEKTINSCVVEESGVGERRYKAIDREVASVNKSGVGEHKYKTISGEEASVNGSGVGECKNRKL
jgi:hypothetical protein